MNELRPELTALPDRIKDLPVHRGYPVPWFVAWVDEVPEFRAMDARKFVQAIKEKLCWVCGERLGSRLCFVLGPMCAVNRTTSEPPAHHECAVWSAINCPFLSRPHMVRRENDLPEQINDPAGDMIRRNPGATILWTTRTYEVFNATQTGGGYLITVGDPERIEAYSEGKPTTLDVVLESIRTGKPFLRIACEKEATMQERIDANKMLDVSLAKCKTLLAEHLLSHQDVTS